MNSSLLRASPVGLYIMAIMLLAVHLMPQFPRAKELEAFRCRHDPLASKIGAHLTLMFPLTIEGELEVLAEHVIACAAEIRPFGLSFGTAESTDEGYVWLPVREGVETVATLHDRLYSGAFTGYRHANRAYLPHVTIGRGEDDDLASMLAEARALEGLSETIRIESLVIEEVMADESSRVVRVVPLGVGL